MVPDITYLLAPLAACGIIAFLLGYFGLHILHRGVIFVDIALAQIAALGITYGHYLGHPPQTIMSYTYAFLFALVASAVFAFVRGDNRDIPQEAIIGICYVVATGLSILLVDMSRDPHGADHIKFLLIGNIAWTTWGEVATLGAVSLVVGLVHLIWFRSFYQATFEKDSEKPRPWWDFLFYFTFSIAVTVMVSVCGVLLVFSYLIIPAVCASLFAQGFRPRLLWGWAVGLAASALGLLFSWERPSGPTIVFFFATILVGASLVRLVYTSDHRKKTALYVILSGGGLAAVFFLLHLVPPPPDGHHHGHHHPSPTTEEKQNDQTSGTSKKHEESQVMVYLKRELEKEEDPLGTEKEAVRIYQMIGEDRRDEILDELSEKAVSFSNSSLQLKAARVLAQGGGYRAVPVLLEILSQAEGALLREEAVQILQKIGGQNFGYDPFLSPRENRKSLEKWKTWWRDQRR